MFLEEIQKLNNLKAEVTGDKNILSNRDTIINYNQNEEREQGVIEDVFNYVITKIKDFPFKKGEPDKLLHTKQKIELNFKLLSEQNEVKEYFTNGYNKLTLIESYFETLGTEEQNDIHNFAFYNYSQLKDKGLKSIKIFRELFKVFIPDYKEKEPMYINIANAIVLFFFDDCTIFEKTEKENNNQTSLFDDI